MLIPFTKKRRLQKKLISGELQEFEVLCKALSQIDRDKEYERMKFNDSKCPRCKSTNIGNRIRNVNGEIDGEISGSLFGTFGFVDGHIQTDDVNKCNDCGEEWKKYSISYDSSDEIKERFERYIRRSFTEEIGRYDNELAPIKIFHLETIKTLFGRTTKELKSLGFIPFNI